MFPYPVPPHEQNTVVRSGTHPLLVCSVSAAMSWFIIAEAPPPWSLPWWLPTSTWRSAKIKRREKLKLHYFLYLYAKYVFVLYSLGILWRAPILSLWDNKQGNPTKHYIKSQNYDRNSITASPSIRVLFIFFLHFLSYFVIHLFMFWFPQFLLTVFFTLCRAV